MEKTAVLLVVACALSACTQTTSLFDGASLAGWQESGEAHWRVHDGNIESSGTGNGYLSTVAEYSDFELSAEFWVDVSTNSGIFIRCKDRANIHPDTCYELNIWDEHPKQEARTGAIVFKVMPPLAQVDTIGRWNLYEVSAKGGVLIVKVNGQTTARMENADPAPGFIALQHYEKGVVKFRNIDIRARSGETGG
jgi:hypothetical protein